MPAIIEAWRAGLLRRENLFSDVTAGLVVGVVALPLAMAFAIASGVKPEHGLYTALVAGLLVTLLGGSRFQIAGPTGAFVVLLASVTAQYGFVGLQITTLLAGIMLVLLGLSRMGAVIRFIPESVVLGFTAGIAIVIVIGQLPGFLGLPPVEGEALFQRLPNLIAALPSLHPATTLLGIASLIVLVFWQRIPLAGRVPAPIVALIAGTAFVAYAQPEGVATIGSVFGGVPRGLPPVTLPTLSWGVIVELLRPAAAVALLGAIESLLSATVADGLAGTRHDPNQELIGQGAANIGASLLGGFAATGAIARTATNIRHGARSPMAGIAHAATIAIVLLVLSPLAYNIPLTTLAAILFVVAFNMSQIGHVVHVAREAPRSDVAVMFVTMALAVFADISLAVEVGVVLALLNFFRRMIGTVDVRQVEAEDLSARLADQEMAMPDGIVVYSVDGPFFFGAVEQFESALAHTGTDPRGVIIQLTHVPFIDLTGLVALTDAVRSFERRGVAVALSGATSEVAERLSGTTVSEMIAGSPAATLPEALAAIESAAALIESTG